MYRNSTYFLILVSTLSLHAQTVNLQGTISDTDGEAISGAVVHLLKADLKDTTGADGAYSLTQTVSSLSSQVMQSGKASLVDGILKIHLLRPTSAKVEIFDVKGNLLKKEIINARASKNYYWNLAKAYPANQLLLVRTSIGRDVNTFRYIPLGVAHSMTSIEDESAVPGVLAKTSTDEDSLKITADGYFSQTVAVAKYDMELDITLTADDGKTPPGPSAGCGEPLGSLRSSYRTITSGGDQRDYYIDIPEDYDPNHPYRLFFTFHYGGGKMQVIVDGIVEWADGTGPEYAFYGLKHQSELADDPGIFIAPDGINGGWTEKAHPFFDDLLAFAKENLCIDTTRVFSTGFSFGGMISYSLSTNHQQQLRAVVGLSPANYNVYLPEKTHEPIAYMSATGMSDNTCPWDGDANQKQGAKYALLEKAEDNECDIPNDIPTTSSGSRTHLCYDFEGCKEGYPVKACTFDGGHIANVGDGGTGNVGGDSWIVSESWKFFSQF